MDLSLTYILVYLLDAALVVADTINAPINLGTNPFNTIPIDSPTKSADIIADMTGHRSATHDSAAAMRRFKSFHSEHLSFLT